MACHLDVFQVSELLMIEKFRNLGMVHLVIQVTDKSS